MGRAPRWVKVGVPVVLLAGLGLALLAGGDEDTAVTASDGSSTTSTTETTTTTTEPSTTTTAPPPPTTVPAGPTEFAATTRSVDRGPDYYAIFHGQTFGGGGHLHVIAKCKPGTVRITVLEDGWKVPPPDGDGPPDPTYLWVWTDGNEIFHAAVADGKVITGRVSAEVSIRVHNPSEHEIRIQYDCRG